MPSQEDEIPRMLSILAQKSGLGANIAPMPGLGLSKLAAFIMVANAPFLCQNQPTSQYEEGGDSNDPTR